MKPPTLGTSPMSLENVEVARKAVDAANARDPDALIACLHPDVEWEESGDVLPGLRGLYRGRAEARRWFEEAFGDAWESVDNEVAEIIEAGEGAIVVELVGTSRGRASGAETELRSWQLLRFADGKIARRQVYWTRDEAFDAAGLVE